MGIFRNAFWHFTVAVAACVCVAGSARGADLIRGEQPAAAPFCDALKRVSDGVLSGKLESAKAAFAGEKSDADLLAAYVKAVVAEKALGAAVKQKFGGEDPGSSLPISYNLSTLSMRLKMGAGSVIPEGETAGTSLMNPIDAGLEFKKVGSVWKVSSMASPKTAAKHQRIITAYAAQIDKLTAGVKQGTIKSADAAKTAARGALEAQIKAAK